MKVIPVTNYLIFNWYSGGYSPIGSTWHCGIPVTKGEIINIISSLKSMKSSGYDGISSKILKLCCMFISTPLSYICNMSIITGVFPDCLKYAVIKPPV
jgi:hypothetical protein